MNVARMLQLVSCTFYHFLLFTGGVVDRANEENDGDDVAEVYIVPMERRRAVPHFPFGDSDDFGSINPVLRQRDYGLTPFFNPFFHQRNDDLDGFLASMQGKMHSIQCNT